MGGPLDERESEKLSPRRQRQCGCAGGRCGGSVGRDVARQAEFKLLEGLSIVAA